MNDLVRQWALERIDDRDRSARSKPQRPGIPGLAAAYRIEHGAVEPDAALIGLGDPCAASAKIAVVAKQQFGHLSRNPLICAVLAEAGTHPSVLTSA
jgi:hypothetical protein